MDNDGFEMEAMEKGLPGNRKPVLDSETFGNGDPNEVRLSSPNVAQYDDDENGRFEEIKAVVETGNGLKLEQLLAQWEEHGWLRDWRNEEGLTLYADAITDGYIGEFARLSYTIYLRVDWLILIG